ncbi:hypothetical protein PYCCODRAFT_1387140 [Trametes coccinea BRFM310]|uniref:Uncharacterized protein n=1 Tax=Trametes coccinea (strain BRFM310) TaxID=1353009 RepID=A0A1Y2IT05_TRAC3|nr:hypothetical protein PYCCODRAFT_1387140 [Trametes coccinea BRFM310]
MSHLTAPMPTGHNAPKPYLFDLPRPAHPLTPPDTEYETLSHQAQPAQNMAGLETEPFLPPQAPSVIDSPYSTLHRKRPSVTYLNSGLRESRERTVQRGLKWLVVVLPPVSFTREHGHLGHTLSSGPTRRLSSGILMPLYPTLNSQLGAIAREFSFPSISGLCVYLHTTHGGVSLAPRVSDDTWPLLWGHIFEARSVSLPPQQLPIGGQIEFDIDLSKARWYDAWLSSSRREHVDVPQSVTPSRAQSISHWRGDSQTSINEPLDDQTDAASVTQAAKPSGRNIKKLSLLDRFDTLSVRSGSKLVPRDESPPSHTARQPSGQQSLSPIVQEDEPMTAKKNIDSRVHSWRMSATAAARSPLAATGQTSLDPANMPNTLTDLPSASTTEMHSELNLDDYDWSVSSVGPPEYDMESVASWGRVPSVHMDRRLEGSVCLTPSICTSFGPDDEDYLYSPISYMDRLPSPDMAWRMLEDVPPTPSTATSWGAPLSYPPSPLSVSYAPSVDMAARCLSSRPATPSTATSWGAPLSYPPSPFVFSRPASPDLAERGMSSVPPSPRFQHTTAAQQYNLVYPYYNAARTASWQHVWPYVEESHAEPEPIAEQREATRMNNFSFPTPAAADPKAQPWRQVWPYAASSTGTEEERDEQVSSTLAYPTMDIYPAVYPSFDIYPALLTLDDRKLGAPAVGSGAAYPIFNLYPAVYPVFNIYPATLTVVLSESKEVSSRLLASYPVIEPCMPSHPLAYSPANTRTDPPVYPYLTIYPATSASTRGTIETVPTKQQSSTPSISVHLPPAYPVFDIYPAVYPYCFEHIYPAVRAPHAVASSGIDIALKASYPVLEIYPAVYPYSLETIYPSVVAERGLESQTSGVSVGVRRQYPVFDIYPPASANHIEYASGGIVINLPQNYPIIEIYPAVYPWNLEGIYPATFVSPENGSGGIVVKLVSAYPAIDIYPAVYPHSLDTIYPAPYSFGSRAAAATRRSSISPRPSVKSTHTRKSSKQRAVPPVPPLPKNARELTPVSLAPRRPLPVLRAVTGISVQLPAVYPNVCPYPPVYPYFSIYPDTTSGDLATVNVELSGKVSAVTQYPHLVIYPSVYPHIEVYPPSWDHVSASTSQALPLPVVRPRPRFTHMELRSQVLASAKQPEPAAVPTRRRPTFSHLELREQVLRTERTSKPRELPRVIVDESSPESSPASADLFSPPEPDFEIVTPVVRSAAPAPVPVQSPFSPPEPDFEIVAASPPGRAPATTSRAPPVPPPRSQPPLPPVSRARSGTVSSRSSVPPVPPVPRPAGARPPAPPIPSASDVPPVPPPARSLNRLSGLPSHPAATRRISSAGPRPMSSFGPLPAVPEPSPGPSPVARRPRVMVSALEEEGRVQSKAASPQLPSPPEDWQRNWKTPTETSPSSRLPGMTSSLSRSNTMPTRPSPRGPRSSTLISERAKLFSSAGGNAGDELLSTLAEFPSPPRPPMPASPARPTVSRLDKSKYPFA